MCIRDSQWKDIAIARGVDSFDSPVELFEDDDFVDITTIGGMDDYTKTADLPGVLDGVFGPKIDVDVLKGYFDGGILNPNNAHDDLKNDSLLQDGVLAPGFHPDVLKNDLLDLTDYALIENLPDGVDLAPYVRKLDLFDNDGGVDIIKPGLYTDTIPDLTPYVLEDHLFLGGVIKPDLYTDTIPDLTPFAKNADLLDGGVIKPELYTDTVPDLTPFARTANLLDGSGMLLNSVTPPGLKNSNISTADIDLSDYVLTVDLPEGADLSQYVKNSDLFTGSSNDTIRPGFYTDTVPDLTPYALAASVPSNADIDGRISNHTDVLALDSQQDIIDDALHSLYKKAVTSATAIEYEGRDGSKGRHITDPIGGDNSDILDAINTRINNNSNVQLGVTARGFFGDGSSGKLNSNNTPDNLKNSNVALDETVGYTDHFTTYKNLKVTNLPTSVFDNDGVYKPSGGVLSSFMSELGLATTSDILTNHKLIVGLLLIMMFKKEC